MKATKNENLQGSILFQHSSIRMHILHIGWFPENSTEYQLRTSNFKQSYKLSFFKEREMLWYRLFPIALRSWTCWQQFHSFSSKQWMTQRQCVYELSNWHNTQLISVKHIWNSWMTISSVRISHLLLFQPRAIHTIFIEQFIQWHLRVISWLLMSVHAFVYKPM